MKTVSKIIFFIVFIFFVSCLEPTGSHKITEKSFPSVIDHEMDSIFYRIDAKGDFEKEVFLMTKNIIVKDSSFGTYTYQKWQEAWKYAKQNDSEPLFLYELSILEDESFKTISRLVFNPSWMLYPVLKTGIHSDTNPVVRKEKDISSLSYLKIMTLSEINLNCTATNIRFINKRWEIFSREILNYDDSGGPRGYCLDTLSIDFKLDTLYFNRAFYLNEEKFNCR
jgi:hypothetical protein